MKDTPTLRLLRHGLTRLKRPKGWIQKSYRQKVNSHHGYCALGAIEGNQNIVPKGYFGAQKYLRQALWALDYKENRHTMDIVTFNDDEKRKKKEVLEVFEKAIQLASR